MRLKKNWQLMLEQQVLRLFHPEQLLSIWHLNLLGVGQGDTVFCSSLTFVASANPILYAGAEPVFIDSEEETWNMSPVALAGAFEDAQAESEVAESSDCRQLVWAKCEDG